MPLQSLQSFSDFGCGGIPPFPRSFRQAWIAESFTCYIEEKPGRNLKSKASARDTALPGLRGEIQWINVLNLANHHTPTIKGWNVDSVEQFVCLDIVVSTEGDPDLVLLVVLTVTIYLTQLNSNLIKRGHTWSLQASRGGILLRCRVFSTARIKRGRTWSSRSVEKVGGPVYFSLLYIYFSYQGIVFPHNFHLGLGCYD